MGYVPPPEALTEEEVSKRIENGARTVAEIDPAFAKWCIPYGTLWFHKLFKTRTYHLLYEIKIN